MYIARRSPHNPLLAPRLEHRWEALAVLNGCPIKVGRKTHMLYRAIGHADVLQSPQSVISIIGKAVSSDGTSYADRKPFITPEKDWEKFGCEDPRVTFFEGKYYIFYTALSEFPFRASGIKVACAISKDLEKIDARHLVTPFNAKAMTLFPERINGKVTVLFTAHTDEPPTKIVMAQAERIEDFWNPEFWEQWHRDIDSHGLSIPHKAEDHFEIGAPPIWTDKGWLLVYSYIQKYFRGNERTFGIEALLLDPKDPKKILGRTHGPILVPEESYEQYGIAGRIVFPSGALLEKKNRLDIYYGAADTVCAKASVLLDDLLAAMTDTSRRSFFTRSAQNPILSPNPTNAWESRATFNPGVLQTGKTINLLYRAMSEVNTSVFGLATTEDGETITERLPDPIYVPRADFEMKKGSQTGNSGCEDPRIVKIGDTLYLTYTAYDGVHPPAVALSTISEKDFVARRFARWSQPILISPKDTDDKDLCIFPKKIGGKHVIFHRINHQICADLVDDLSFKDHRINRCIEVMRPREGMWDSEKIGIAGPPIETKLGWLLFYHGISSDKAYRLGVALLDKNDPTRVLARAVDPILEPLEQYEREGQIPRVVFSCGQAVQKDTIFLYYAGADEVIGVATGSLSKLLAILAPQALES